MIEQVTNKQEFTQGTEELQHMMNVFNDLQTKYTNMDDEDKTSNHRMELMAVSDNIQKLGNKLKKWMEDNDVTVVDIK